MGKGTKEEKMFAIFFSFWTQNTFFLCVWIHFFPEYSSHQPSPQEKPSENLHIEWDFLLSYGLACSNSCLILRPLSSSNPLVGLAN